jgi:hypothetical protein
VPAVPVAPDTIGEPVSVLKIARAESAEIASVDAPAVLVSPSVKAGVVNTIVEGIGVTVIVII